ncbi:MAG: hypothetical protein E7566_06205 [Ruminococcaceae bacterium]|nr:hypothetical protein [Oscillospiraceae bacterium]
MSKKNKDKKNINKDVAIDSIIEETRYLSEKEEMEKAALKLSGGPKMEEIYSNTSKEIRLTNKSPLDADLEDEEEGESTAKPSQEEPAEKAEEAKANPEESDTVVTLTPEYDEGTKISEEVIEKVDSFTVHSIRMKDVDTIDIDLDDEEEEPETSENKKNETQASDSQSNFERLFGKPKPIGAVQTVVSKVPVYQHESKVEKVHVRAGKFSAVVENEYKKYIASPNPIISQNVKAEPDMPETEESQEKASAGKVASGVIGKVAGFFSSHEDDDNEDFKEKTIQIEDYRSPQDAKSIILEVNSNIKKMFINSIFTGALFVISLILTIIGRASVHSFASSITLAIFNFLILCVSGWVCRVTILNGLTPLKKFKGNSDTGAAIALSAALLQSAVAMFTPARFFSGDLNLFTSIAILALLLNCLGKFFMVRRVKENFKFITSKTTAAYSAKIYTNEDIARQFISGTTMGKPIVAYQHETDFLSDFLRLSYSPDPSEDMASKIAPVTLLFSLFVGILYGIFAKDIVGAFSAFSILSCVSVPVCDLLAVNLPMHKLCKDTLSKNAMISGYPAVRQFCDTKAVICEARDLYPIDSITLNGVKAFSNNRVEAGMLAAAAILTEAKSPMACVFDHVIATNKNKVPKVESVLYEDNLGLVGWVEGERILVGNKALLDKYAVALPVEDFEEKHTKDGKLVTYLARSGELLAMFVTTYDTTLRIAELLKCAEANGISLLVHTTDCNVTGEKISADFGIFYRSVKVLPTGLGNVCQEITSQKEDSSRAYLSTRGSFLSLLRALCGCVKLKNSTSLAVVIQLIGIVLGVVIVSALSLFAGAGILKNLEMLLFILLWAAATLIVPLFHKP